MHLTLNDLYAERKSLNARYKNFATILFTRELSEDEEKEKYDVKSAIDSLDKRISAIEGMEDRDDEEEMPAEEEGGSEKEKEEIEPRSKYRHLDFKISSSKTRKDSHTYNIQRALQMSLAGHSVDGLEGETSREIALQGGGTPKGFFMPWTAPLRGRHRVPKDFQKRDFTTTTGTGAVGINVQSTLIDLLRARLVFDKLGGKIMTDCVGKFALPRQTQAASYYFVGEGSNVTTSNPVLDQVNFVPKTMGMRVLTSRKNIVESSIDAMSLVEDDVMKSLQRGLENTILQGIGSGATPTGILSQSGISTVALSADAGNGADLSYADILNFEATVANSNADMGSLGWCTTPGVRAKLKQTPKNGSGYPEFVWETGNSIIGYDAEVTTNMPSGLTKGSVSNLHSIIYGNWSDCVLALWTGIDIFLDPYTSGAQGAVIFQAFQEVDVELLHPQSFAVSSAVSIS